MRKKVRQSSRSGIEILEYTSNDFQIEQSMEQLATAWVAARRGIQVYLATPTLFVDRTEKRWFFAK